MEAFKQLLQRAKPLPAIAVFVYMIYVLAYQLQPWDYHHGTGGNLDWQYYQDMAWGGMADYADPNDNSTTLFYQEFDDYLNSLVENIDDENRRNEKRQEIEERILNTNIREKTTIKIRAKMERKIIVNNDE